jgi:phosphohistidine phosphatase
VPPRRLVLVRHAQAADGPVDAGPAADRAGLPARRRDRGLAGAGRVRARPGARLPGPPGRGDLERAGERLGQGARPTVDTRIHATTVEALLAAIRETPDDVQTLAVVGHNPSIGGLAAALDDGQGSPAARADVGAGVPAGGVAVFELATPFAGIGAGAATLEDFAVPGD